MTTTATRTDQRQCQHCEASVAGCETRNNLGGRWCCTTCTGNHDQPRGLNP